MSTSINKSVSGVQTRFNKRSQPALLPQDMSAQIVTRSARNPELEPARRAWRSRRVPQHSDIPPLITSRDPAPDENGREDIETCNGDNSLPEQDSNNDDTFTLEHDNGRLDSVEEEELVDDGDKSKVGGKHLRTLVNRLAPTPGFVDKNSLPEDLQSRRRVRRLASLNAAAKVNVYYEPSSTLAGRSLTDIMQHSKKIQGGEGEEVGLLALGDGKENSYQNTKSFLDGEDPLNHFDDPGGGVFETKTDVLADSALMTSSSDVAVTKRALESSAEEALEAKRAKIVDTSPVIGNKRMFRGKEVVDVGLQVEIPRTPVTSSSNTRYCKCRSSKVLDVPIQSYVSTYSNGTLVSIPITKKHRLTPQVPEKPAPELALGDLACRSKRIAGLNSRAMLNAILTEEREVPPCLGNTKYRKGNKKGFYEHGLNNTIPSRLKIPKINFAATSTSNFHPYGRGKTWASHLAKSPHLQKSNIPTHSGPKRTNGWFFLEPPIIKPYYYAHGEFTVTRKYYSGIKRNNEVICVRDSVLLKSGPRRKDLPFVARVSGFWEELDGPHVGEMMMSVLWYYRPEQTDIGMQPDIHGENEILASRHKDDNSVACIVDKCYVLSYPEYCRYRAAVKRSQDSRMPSANPVPPGHVTNCGEQAPLSADPKLVFFCRQIYDYRMGRIMKNAVKKPLLYSVG